MLRTCIFAALIATAVATRIQPKPSHTKLGFLERDARSRSKSGTMASLYPFYHTSDAIKSELQALASRCHGMQLETVSGSGDDGQQRDIDVVTVRASRDASPAANRVFMLFGEHSRELISPESGLHFIKTLCGETDLSPQAAEVLKDSEFRIVVNGNPASRQRVEQGDFCLRVNPDGVDLNRNWDEEWQPSADMAPAQTNPGPQPFSEPETRVFKQLVEQYKPTTFLTVHSGTKGMYMPWAYDMEHLAKRNQPQMMQILTVLDREHCQCPYGAAGKEVGYSCPGTCLDWVYDKLNTPFAFAFEIYTGPEYSDMLRERWQEKMRGAGAFYQKHSHLAHKHFHQFFAEHPSCFVQLKSGHRAARAMSNDECFGQFNPNSEDEYTSVVENWSSAYLSMASMVVQDLKGNSTTDATMVVAA